MTEHYLPYHATSLTTGENLRCSSTDSPIQSREEMGDSIVCCPLLPNVERGCSLFDCGDDAVWGVYLQGDTRPNILLCDRCRQEWVRAKTVYITPDGWNWDDDEVYVQNDTVFTPVWYSM